MKKLMILTILLINTAFAQNFLPELGKEEITLCMKKDTTMDPTCSCRANNSCYNIVNETNRDKIAKYGQENTKHLGNDYAAVFKQTMGLEQIVSSIFNGKTDINKLDVKKFEEMNQKFEKINAKLLPAVAKKLSQQHKQNIDFNKMAEAWDKNLLKSAFDKDQMQALNDLSLSEIGSSVSDPTESMERTPASANLADAASESFNQTTPDFNTQKESPTESEEITAENKVEESTEQGIGDGRSISSAQVDEALQKKFEFDDINKKSEQNIFDVLSNRYRLKSPELNTIE
jgi:hypothetical protein